MGSNLILESETTLKLYFASEEGVAAANLQFMRNNELLEVSEYETNGETWICIPITNIAAHELGTAIAITVSDETTSTSDTLKYSALTYSYNVLKGTNYSENLQNLVKALYLYNQAAIAYRN